MSKEEKIVIFLALLTGEIGISFEMIHGIQTNGFARSGAIKVCNGIIFGAINRFMIEFEYRLKDVI